MSNPESRPVEQKCAFDGCVGDEAGDWMHLSCAEDEGTLALCPLEPKEDGFCHNVTCHPFVPLYVTPDPITEGLEGEKIEGSAIRDPRGGFYSLPIPASHFAVSEAIKKNIPSAKPLRWEQGFRTTTGRFVGRAEARRIAVAANQIVNPITGSEDLFSEELWTPSPVQETVAQEEGTLTVSTYDAELLLQIEVARQHCYDLSAGRKKWTMTIPPQDTDSDVMLDDVLDSAAKRIRELLTAKESTR